MNPLQNYFEKNTSNQIDKWTHYFDVYTRYFNRYVGKEVVVLEIGIFQGGSIKMWKNYFGDKAKIYAIDIHPPCKQFEEENVEIFIGSQSDRNFLRSVKEKIPKVDILIDDGGHFMDQQIVTFEEMYDHIKPDGIYLCEDMHTSYWSLYNGGYKKPSTFIEYTKNFVDYLNAWHSQSEALQVNGFTRSAYSVHFYDSIVVVEKKPMERPETRSIGQRVLPIDGFLDILHQTQTEQKLLPSRTEGLMGAIKRRVKSYLKI